MEYLAWQGFASRYFYGLPGCTHQHDRWLSLSLLTAYQNFMHVVYLCFTLSTSHTTNYNPCSASCLLSLPVSAPHTFLCRHSFTLFDHIGCRNIACFPPLITVIPIGGATSYHIITVFLSSRLRPASMITHSSLQMHAAPAWGDISMGSTFTPLSATPFFASLDTTLISKNCWL